MNLEGDDQADRNAHGGPDKAVYAYAAEDLRWWEPELGRSLVHGEFGENFTTEGIDVNGALVGERWEIGNAVFEVNEMDHGQPRTVPASRRPGNCSGQSRLAEDSD